MKSRKNLHTFAVAFNPFDNGIVYPILDAETAWDMKEEMDTHMLRIIADITVAARSIGLQDICFDFATEEDYPLALNAAILFSATKNIRGSKKVQEVQERITDNICLVLERIILEVPDA